MRAIWDWIRVKTMYDYKYLSCQFRTRSDAENDRLAEMWF